MTGSPSPQEAENAVSIPAMPRVTRNPSDSRNDAMASADLVSSNFSSA